MTNVARGKKEMEEDIDDIEEEDMEENMDEEDIFDIIDEDEGLCSGIFDICPLMNMKETVMDFCPLLGMKDKIADKVKKFLG